MKAPNTGLSAVLETTFNSLKQARDEHEQQLILREVGTVISVNTGVASVSGLSSAGFEEIVKFHNGLSGVVFNLEEEEIGVILLGDSADLSAKTEVKCTGRVMDICVGEGLLGRVLDPLGKPLDNQGPIKYSQRMPIERESASIMDRAPVTVPMQTGLKVVDALIPIGQGQRELILGDRQTGKTAIALDTIINQKEKDIICVYCAIGQRSASTAGVIARLREHGAMDYSVIVVAEGNEAPGIQYIAPYAATSIAEYFMEQGRNVLIIYDDLTHHARAYRELSLLLRRPPGREAYPGDIFYIHSRLLERATHLRDKLGGGSLTALPIIETEAQNLSAYIPTNLISITDGQIYLSPTLFQKGILPAVDVGKSVSRVGGKTQLVAYRAVAGDLKLAYSQFEELESFARFGTRLDDESRRKIEHGQRIRSCLKQPALQPIPVIEQITVLLTLSKGLFDNISLDNMGQAEKAIRKGAYQLPKEIQERILRGEKMSQENQDKIIAMAVDILSQFQDPK